MSLKNYSVKIGGLEHTLQLSDADAARLGDDARLIEDTAPAPAAKARKPSNKAAPKPSTKAAPKAAEPEAAASDDSDW